MKALRILTPVFIGIITWACGPSPASETTSSADSAQWVVDKAIEASGGALYLDARIEFDFRDMHYVNIRKGGSFTYERLFTDSVSSFRDVLNNEGFKRYVNDTLSDVHDTMAVKYTSSVNSVHYFAMLPYGLNDPAVIKEYLGKTALGDKTYYKLRITFREEGGGEDYQDVFVYWIGIEDLFIDYFAYTYEEDGELGARFREAYNARVLGGIRFQDYINYKPADGMPLKVESFDSYFMNGELEELSRIETENIQVSSGS